MRFCFFLSAGLLVLVQANAQYITSTFPGLVSQQVKLTGFEGFRTYTIDSIKVDESGIFKLSFSKNDYGMACLSSEDNKSFIVVLVPHEDLKLEGETFDFPPAIIIKSGRQNQLLGQYSKEHLQREQALSAWDFLDRIYRSDSLFSFNNKPRSVIESEKLRINEEDQFFLESLKPETYISWYLPIRKLVSSVQTIAQYRPGEIPSAINAFRKIDYTDERLYKSGLLSDAIESHFWLIENSGRSLDSVYAEMKISIDQLIENLLADERKFNLITDHLFNLLEKRSLFVASEYLAIKILTQNSCTVNDDLAKQLESYRAMKKGNTAPDIVFSGDVLVSGSFIKTPGRLSDIVSAYKVVIFGGSWCPKCAEELSQLLPLYQKWKSKGVEVVFISLDTDKTLFKSFSGIFPFVSICDYKKWNTKAVNDYYVFATPALFMMDKDLKIVLRPNSVKQIDAWVDFYLKENKELKQQTKR
jgi:thiol-disulfide isomerase/thioredoxin